MATTEEHEVGAWDTVHNNGPFPTEIIFETALDRSISDPYACYNDAAKEIRRLLQKCLDEGKRFRAYGSSWSLSDIPHQQDRMHYNDDMNLRFDIIDEDLHPDTNFANEDIYFFQCGNRVKEINAFLKQRGRALKTTGASNGQTIVGAMSTGVHGSAIDVGSIQDTVVGLHIIIGPNETDSVYLESEDQPALGNSFVNKINARVIRNTQLFNAALVGLGSFGFISGVTIEAERLYLLKRYTAYIEPEDAMVLANTLDFASSNFKIPEEVDSNGNGIRPYHLKIYINPYNPNEKYVAEIMFKKPYREDYPDPRPDQTKLINTESIGNMVALAVKAKWIIPKLIKFMKKKIFPALDQVSEGTIGEIFTDTVHRGPGFAWAIGVKHTDSELATKLFVDVVNKMGPVPGAIALRFVKASKATLGFTRFPFTCIVEMDGITWKPNNKLKSMKEFEKALVDRFQKEGVEFTWHWGKNCVWSHPGLIDYMYGDLDDQWKDQRSKLLRKEMADMFTNDFIQRCGLSDYRKQIGDTYS